MTEKHRAKVGLKQFLDLQFTFFPQEGEINVFPPTAFLIEIT
jgi:hypothetical protein